MCDRLSVMAVDRMSGLILRGREGRISDAALLATSNWSLLWARADVIALLGRIHVGEEPHEDASDEENSEEKELLLPYGGLKVMVAGVLAVALAVGVDSDEVASIGAGLEGEMVVRDRLDGAGREGSE